MRANAVVSMDEREDWGRLWGEKSTYGWARRVGARVLDMVGWDLGRFGVEG